MGFKLRFNRGWGKFISYFSERRRRDLLYRETQRKVKEQLVLLRRDIVQYVQDERHGVENSPLTILTKGSSKPLVDRGDLRQGISEETAVKPRGVDGAVGVLRSKRSSDGQKLWNVAAALHEGYTVRVTPKVRAAVFAEMRKRRGRRVEVPSSGAAGASTWKVRGRPFIQVPFDDAEERIKMALGDGVRLTLMRE